VKFVCETPKGLSLAGYTRFEPSTEQIRSRVFALDVCTKKGTLQKVTERLYFTYLAGIPHPTKFNQNWHMSRGRRCNQSCQVWQWSIKGVRSYRGSNFCLAP